MPENEEYKQENNSAGNNPPADNEGSALNDIFHVLGFKKRTKPEPPKDSTAETESLTKPVIEETAPEPEAAPPAITEPPEPAEKTPNGRRTLAVKIAIGAAVAAIGLYFGIPLLHRITEPRPPAPDVAFSFNGKNITAEELEAFIRMENYSVTTLDGFRQMATLYAIEQIILDWARKNGVTQREEIQHTMKDLLNDAMISRYVRQLHDENITANAISRWEVQQYYDANISRYREKTLAESEDEIRRELLAQKEEDFFPQYIEELKRTAGLLTNFELLNITEQDEITLRRNETLFSIHSRRFTLGDFYQEFNELSPSNQERFAGIEAKKRLVEQIIAQELLLEESIDKSTGSEEDHRMEELRIQYLSQILHNEEVDEKLSEPTDEEIQEYYNKNKKLFTTHAAVQLGLIWIDQGLNGERKQEARRKAEEALAALKNGTSFEDVAKTYSEDTSAQEGGFIRNYLHEEQLPPALRKPALTLKAGAFSSIADYGNAYFIIKVHDRTEPQRQTLEEVSAAIHNYLTQLKHEQMEHEIQETLLKNSRFTIYNRTLRRLVKAAQNE